MWEYLIHVAPPISVWAHCDFSPCLPHFWPIRAYLPRLESIVPVNHISAHVIIWRQRNVAEKLAAKCCSFPLFYALSLSATLVYYSASESMVVLSCTPKRLVDGFCSDLMEGGVFAACSVFNLRNTVARRSPSWTRLSSQIARWSRSTWSPWWWEPSWPRTPSSDRSWASAWYNTEHCTEHVTMTSLEERLKWTGKKPWAGT